MYYFSFLKAGLQVVSVVTVPDLHIDQVCFGASYAIIMEETCSVPLRTVDLPLWKIILFHTVHKVPSFMKDRALPLLKLVGRTRYGEASRFGGLGFWQESDERSIKMHVEGLDS
jgi:hypothetical protein